MSDDAAFSHRSVMSRELVEALAPRVGGIYADCTFGRGGHAKAILERIGPEGRLLAIDRDPQAVECARDLARSDPRLRAIQAPFGSIAQVVAEAGFLSGLDGIVMDLGVSSPQLDDPRRGFGFSHDGPLDMRMNPDTGISAAEWLAEAQDKEIARVLHELGEERAAKRIARAIVAVRKTEGALRTTAQLASLVARISPPKPSAKKKSRTQTSRKHPATRTFQAIRMHVNDEIGEIERALAAIPDLLVMGGRLAVITFHSLEDRLVKRAMRAPPEQGFPRRLPLPEEALSAERGRALLSSIAPVRGPDPQEIANNPRARSAKLRVAERRR